MEITLQQLIWGAAESSAVDLVTIILQFKVEAFSMSHMTYQSADSTPWKSRVMLCNNSDIFDILVIQLYLISVFHFLKCHCIVF